MALDKVLSTSIAEGAVTAAAISNTANLVVGSISANGAELTSINATSISSGTLNVDRISNSSITSAKLASNTANENIGYVPVNKAGDTMSGQLVVNRGNVGNEAYIGISIENSQTSAGLTLDCQQTGNTSGRKYELQSTATASGGSFIIYDRDSDITRFLIDNIGNILSSNSINKIGVSNSYFTAPSVFGSTTIPSTAFPIQAVVSPNVGGENALLGDGSVYALNLVNSSANTSAAVGLSFGHETSPFTNFIGSVRNTASATPSGDLILGGRPSAATNFVVNQKLHSSGAVTFPRQVSFHVTRGIVGDQAFGSSEDVLQFDTTFHNTGSYSTSTYRFTAPVAGRYLFCCTARYDGLTAGSYARLDFYVNGSSSNHRYGHFITGNNHSTDYESLSISAIISLSAGDYVDTRGGRQGGGGGLQFESQFSGMLLG